MKLCYVLPKYDEKAGEHFFHIHTLLKELSRFMKIGVLIEKCRGKPTGTFKDLAIIRSSWFPLRLFETFWKLLVFRLKGYRTFYVHYSFFAALTGALITRLLGGRVFYWNCGLPHLFFKSFGEKEWLRSKLNDDWPLRLSLKAVHYLVTGTPLMKQYYHDQFGVPLHKIVVVPNEIDLRRFKPTKPRNKIPVVLFVHRISERKGAQYVVPIAERVLKKTKARFVIAGDGPYLPQLKAEIAKKRLDRWITVLGSVPNKEVPKLYAKADVFLMPSMEEGFPRVLLEAMAMGTPFVASDVGGVRDIVSPRARAFVVPSGNVEGFAEKLSELLSDKKERERLSKEGLKHIKQYDVKNVVRLLAKTLTS
jgi:glycosyltransferase involved in cell wall biosynthesis